jgi:hypothetical protein
MKDHLLDLVEHTHDLGVIDLVKITGTDAETAIFGIAEDRSVIVEGKYTNPVAEFIGLFGMPNLGKLKILLNLPEYKEESDLAITKNAKGDPDGVNFKNKTADFKNNYRFMAAEIVTEKAKNVKFKGTTWNVEFTPTIAGIQRLKMQAQANAEEPNFTVKTENNDLKFVFGDHSTHSGNFVFQPSVSGQLKRAWAYPVKTVISILDLTGDKTMRLSDDGVAEITVDSGLAIYNYKIPAQSK